MPPARAARREPLVGHRATGKARRVGPGARRPASGRKPTSPRGKGWLQCSTSLSCLAGRVPAARTLRRARGRPATVTVRVEGSGDTLVPDTRVHDDARRRSSRTATADTCTGTSAAGALELATAGNWGGAYDSARLAVETIIGETHSSSEPTFCGQLLLELRLEQRVVPRASAIASCRPATSCCSSPPAAAHRRCSARRRPDRSVQPGGGRSRLRRSRRRSRRSDDARLRAVKRARRGATVSGAVTRDDRRRRARDADAYGDAARRCARCDVSRAGARSRQRPSASPTATTAPAARASRDVAGRRACVPPATTALCGTNDRRAPRGEIVGRSATASASPAATAPRTLSGIVRSDPSGSPRCACA